MQQKVFEGFTTASLTCVKHVTVTCCSGRD